MKKFLLAASILGALIITIGVFAVQANTEAKKAQRLTVQFTQPVKLMNVILKGEYTILHDDVKMAQGEDCTYLYDKSGNLVVSFHCVPVEREKAKTFRVVTRRINNNLSELTEYQFEGDTEAHQVP